MMKFVLVDESNGAKTSSGEALNPTLLGWAARILDVFLNRCVSAFWGIAGGAMVRAASSVTDILENEWPQFINKDLVNAPGAIAYHTVNGVGVPALYDGISLSDTLFGPSGWLTAISHEFAETVGDPGTNLLAADNLGKLFAIELSDPVETQSFPLTILPDGSLASVAHTSAGLALDGSFTAYVSNFVTPRYFTPNSEGPYDYMTAAGLAGGTSPKGPFQIVPSGGGNYQIWERDPQSESQAFAARSPLEFEAAEATKFGRVHVSGSLGYRSAKKGRPTSRGYRRGLRIGTASPTPVHVGLGI